MNMDTPNDWVDWVTPLTVTNTKIPTRETVIRSASLRNLVYFQSSYKHFLGVFPAATLDDYADIHELPYRLAWALWEFCRWEYSEFVTELYFNAEAAVRRHLYNPEGEGLGRFTVSPPKAITISEEIVLNMCKKRGWYCPAVCGLEPPSQ